jgi:FixJ family two-component response regulator
MRGRELASRLLETRAGLRTIFMSGHADPSVAPGGIIDPVTPFLQKPFSGATLTRKIREVLDHA